jgi:integrase/recombinase XerD
MPAHTRPRGTTNRLRRRDGDGGAYVEYRHARWHTAGMASGRSHVDFALAVASWLAGQRSEHTRDAYRRDLERYVEWWTSVRDGSPLDTGTDDLHAYRDSIVGGPLAASTVARRLASLGSFFAHAAGRGLIAAAPKTPDAAPPGAPRPARLLTEAQVEQLRAAAAELGGRHHVLFALLLFDKRRLSDILEYDVTDVRLGKGGATLIDTTGTPWAPDPRTVAALRPHVAGRDAGPLLESHSGGRRLSRFGADFLLRQISGHAGIDPAVSANGLRRADAGHAS